MATRVDTKCREAIRVTKMFTAAIHHAINAGPHNSPPHLPPKRYPSGHNNATCITPSSAKILKTVCLVVLSLECCNLYSRNTWQLPTGTGISVFIPFLPYFLLLNISIPTMLLPNHVWWHRQYTSVRWTRHSLDMGGGGVTIAHPVHDCAWLSCPMTCTNKRSRP